MVRSRWFVVKWVNGLSTHASWGLPPLLVEKAKKSTDDFLDTAASIAVSLAIQEEMKYLNLFSGAFEGTRNKATAFCRRADAEQAAVEVVLRKPDLIGKVQVLRLRQKIGPLFLYQRAPTCQRCGTYSVFITRHDGSYNCADEFECCRRKTMKMGKPVPPSEPTVQMMSGWERL